MNSQTRIPKILALTLSVFSVAHSVASQSVPKANAGNGSEPSSLRKQPAGKVDPTSLHQREWRYTVHTSDTLELSFLKTPEFNQTVTVLPDGYISLRDIGTLPVAGQTLPELTESIKRAYSKILRDPEISVNTKDFEKPYVTVGGEVGKPGKIEWRGSVTLTQAIALAGGFTEAAKHSQVLLFRRVSDQWAEAKLINVKQMLSARTLAEDPILQPGDMLYVPKNALSKIKPFIPIPSIGSYIPL